MEAFQQLIREAINKMGLKLSEQEKENSIQLMIKIFDQGVKPKDALNLSDDIMNGAESASQATDSEISETNFAIALEAVEDASFAAPDSE